MQSSAAPIAFPTLAQAPRKAYELALLIKSAHWFVFGKGFLSIHEYLDTLFENAVNDADYFGELAAELKCNIEPLFGQNLNKSDSVQPATKSLGVTECMLMVSAAIAEYLEFLAITYENIPQQDIRAEFDTINRFWKKAHSFFLAGELGGVK
jgi:DNA-binding ferritin-like protein